MRVIAHSSTLFETLAADNLHSARGGAPKLCTGVDALDEIAPGKGFVCGAVHELLSAGEASSFLFAVLLARSAAKNGWIVWCDREHQFYPPAAAALGLPLDRLLLLQATNEKEDLWGAIESLRCKGVAACVASPARLSPLQARRFQLAAERGGGCGILLRPAKAKVLPYAAATRWLISPEPGEKMTQRIGIQLVHGHGGRVGQSIIVEQNRETDIVRAVSPLANRSLAAEKTRAFA